MTHDEIEDLLFDHRLQLARLEERCINLSKEISDLKLRDRESSEDLRTIETNHSSDSTSLVIRLTLIEKEFGQLKLANDRAGNVRMSVMIVFLCAILSGLVSIYLPDLL